MRSVTVANAYTISLLVFRGIKKKTKFELFITKMYKTNKKDKRGQKLVGVCGRVGGKEYNFARNFIFFKTFQFLHETWVNFFIITEDGKNER